MYSSLQLNAGTDLEVKRADLLFQKREFCFLGISKSIKINYLKKVRCLNASRAVKSAFFSPSVENSQDVVSRHTQCFSNATF